MFNDSLVAEMVDRADVVFHLAARVGGIAFNLLLAAVRLLGGPIGSYAEFRAFTEF